MANKEDIKVKNTQKNGIFVKITDVITLTKQLLPINVNLTLRHKLVLAVYSFPFFAPISYLHAAGIAIEYIG